MGNFADAFDRAATGIVDRLLIHLPQLLGAAALLLVGWLLAKLLRVVTARAVTLLEAVLARWLPRSTAPSRWRVGRSASLLANIVYWVVLLFFITAATQTLGLQTFTDWLARLLDHLPSIAAGLLIAAAGYVVSGFVAELVRAAATSLADPQRVALARLAQGATLALALLVGADQIGLKVTWIAILAALMLASLLGGVTVAVSLGARGYVANLIGAHHLRQSLRLGQRVRVAGHEGRVVAMSATSLVLETEEGRVALPGRVYHDEPLTVLTRPRP